MKVLTGRHGEQLYPYNAEGKKLVCGVGAPLIELGRAQMRQLGEVFIRKGIVIEAVYTSPLLRARQSTDELLGSRKTPIYVIDDLKEIFPNSAEGHTYEELAAVGGDIYAHPFGPQESLEHLVKRSREAKDFLLEDAKSKGFETIVIVGHGDPLSALDWTFLHPELPTGYPAMRDSYYPQKGQAKEYFFSSNLKLEGAGEIITTDAARQTIEGFRNSAGGEKK